MSTRIEATIEDLYRLPHEVKAEIVDGEIVTLSPTGFMPGRSASVIYASLRRIERQAGGYAVPDNVAFEVDLPNRKSFSPDAAFFKGDASGMRFLVGAPVFAVEIRSENDYGPAAEAKLAKKRADYFAAGTLVVWDVDLLGAEVVRVYRSSEPTAPAIFRRGEIANAEPAVEGWSLAVDDIFD